MDSLDREKLRVLTSSAIELPSSMSEGRWTVSFHSRISFATSLCMPIAWV